MLAVSIYGSYVSFGAATFFLSPFNPKYALYKKISWINLKWLYCVPPQCTSFLCINILTNIFSNTGLGVVHVNREGSLLQKIKEVSCDILELCHDDLVTCSSFGQQIFPEDLCLSSVFLTTWKIWHWFHVFKPLLRVMHSDWVQVLGHPGRSHLWYLTAVGIPLSIWSTYLLEHTDPERVSVGLWTLEIMSVFTCAFFSPGSSILGIRTR